MTALISVFVLLVAPWWALGGGLVSFPWWTVLAGQLVYVFLAAFTNGVISGIGTRNPMTRGDCFTGDDYLDVLIVIWWPLFWLTWPITALVSAAFRLGRGRS